MVPGNILAALLPGTAPGCPRHGAARGPLDRGGVAPSDGRQDYYADAYEAVN